MNSVYVYTPILRDQEISFWKRLSNALHDNYSLRIFLSGPYVHSFRQLSDSLVLLPNLTINPSNHDFHGFPCDLENLFRKIQQQGLLWNKAYDFNSFCGDASNICFHLSILTPNLVLVWNWHSTQGMLARSIAECMGLKCMNIERTPWPGMLTVDENGQLCETILSADLRNFSDKYPSLKSPLENDLSLYLDRGNEYIRTITADSYTWWQQPSGGNSKVEELRKREEFNGSKYRILFAGQVDNDVQRFLFGFQAKSNLEAFELFMSSLPDGAFVIGKHHPMSDIPASEYQSIIDKTDNVAGVWTLDLDVDNSLSLVDHVVAVNSSFLFEALCRGKACFELGFTMISGTNIFYDCSEGHDLRSALEKWLHAPKADISSRALRFRVLTGYALSHGLLSFEDLPFSFDAMKCEQFVRLWLDQILFYRDQSIANPILHQDFIVSREALHSLSVNSLMNHICMLQGLSRDSALGVRKSFGALLASVKNSVKFRMRRFT